MKTIRYTPLAEFDLNEIWDYIAQDDGDVASGLIRQLVKVFWRLAENPDLGRKRSDLLPHLRLFPYKRYLVFYIPLNNGIEIYRVLHSARDIESQFEM
jgi:toxin ParE1/3/4